MLWHIISCDNMVWNCHGNMMYKLFVGDMLTSPELEDIDETGFGKSTPLNIAGGSRYV